MDIATHGTERVSNVTPSYEGVLRAEAVIANETNKQDDLAQKGRPDGLDT